jgi:hypothetical protein
MVNNCGDYLRADDPLVPDITKSFSARSPTKCPECRSPRLRFRYADNRRIRRRCVMSGGGQSAAWGLRYQYLRTLEALMDAVEEPRRGVAAVHVEGMPRDDERTPEGIDYELTDADGHVVLAAQVKARAARTRMGAGEVFKALVAVVRDRDATCYRNCSSAHRLGYQRIPSWPC